MNALESAIKEVGSAAALAGTLNITAQAVGLWRRAGKPPAERCLAIQQLTDGRITCHDLRPDVFPEPEEVSA